MKRWILCSLILLTSTAQAKWTQVSCAADLTSMQMSKGLIVGLRKIKDKTECSKDEKMCIMQELCTFVDSDILAFYGTFDKIPKDTLAKSTIIAHGNAVCTLDNGHCPSFSVCNGDTDQFEQHYVDMDWDEKVQMIPGAIGHLGAPPADATNAGAVK